MAAMKPRTGDGPLEVTKEGRGIVMRVPLEGGGRLVSSSTPTRPVPSAMPSRTLSADRPTDLRPRRRAVSLPAVSRSSQRFPHAVRGVEVVALPVLPGRRHASGEPPTVLLGPGADELSDALGPTCWASSSSTRPPARPARSTRPVPLGAPATTPALGAAGRRRRAAPGRLPARRRRPGRATRDRDSVATTIPAVAPDGGLEAFVVGAMLGSFGFHWRSSPEHTPVARVVLAGLPTPRTRPRAGRAIAVGGAGWRAGRSRPCPPTSRTRPGWPSRPGGRRTRPASRSRSGTRRSSAATASAASSASAGLGDPAPADPPRLHPAKAGRKTPARRARRQGHHLRHRRPVDQAGRVHGRT